MDIIGIAERTGLPQRRLRYVLDHSIVAEFDKLKKGHRVSRQFAPSQAFFLALVALLFEAGLRRSLVEECVGRLKKRHGSHGALHDLIYEDGTITHIEIADWSNFRLWRGEPLAAAERWTQIGTGATLAEDYEPLVTLRLAVHLLRQQLPPECPG
jgi:hypothetical protein